MGAAIHACFMHTVPLFRNIKGETSSESLSRRFPGVTSLPSQPTSVLQALIPAHWWARHISLSSPVFVIKTSGWKALKDHTCLMKIFWGLRKSKNLPKKNSKFAHVLIYRASLSVPGLQKYMVQKSSVFCIPPAPAYDMYHTSKYTLGLFSYISFCNFL